MSILEKILDMISPNSPTIPGYPRCLGMTGQIMSRQDRQFGVSGSWLGFGVRGARHSSFGTEDWKFKQKFSSIKSSHQIIYHIAQK